MIGSNSRRGRLFVIAAPSGAGKTSLVRALMEREPGLRFYAGAPLVTPQGLVMGTVCVLDTKPRTLTPAQNQTLCNLAEAVMRLLLLRAPADEAQALALSPRAA